MVYNANFNQDMLRDFVEGKVAINTTIDSISESSFLFHVNSAQSFGEPLKQRLNTLEK